MKILIMTMIAKSGLGTLQFKSRDPCIVRTCFVESIHDFNETNLQAGVTTEPMFLNSMVLKMHPYNTLKGRFKVL